MFLPGLNLAYTDRASMAASTEVRVPVRGPRGGRRRRSPCPAPQDRRPRRRRRRSKQAAGRGCPTRSSTGRRPPSARRCGPGSPTTWASSIDDLLVGGELVAAGFLRRDAAAAADRRPAGRAAGRVQADLAAAHPRALVPQRASAGVAAPEHDALAARPDVHAGRPDEADSAELQVRRARRARRARARVPARRRARPVARTRSSPPAPR